MQLVSQPDGEHPLTCPSCGHKMDCAVEMTEDETRVDFHCPMDVEHEGFTLVGSTDHIPRGEDYAPRT